MTMAVTTSSTARTAAPSWAPISRHMLGGAGGSGIGAGRALDAAALRAEAVPGDRLAAAEAAARGGPFHGRRGSVPAGLSGPHTLRRMIQTGEQAPDFELPDHDGNPVRLSALRGRPVVLYFYPKADTPGCTTQACGIRDHRADYEAAGVTVLGVSPDPVEAIAKFHDGQDLNFTLLADADHAVAEEYGVWGEKSMYGRTYMGVNRSTFVIDADGTVVHVIPKASPKTHDDQVLKALRETVLAA